MEMALEGGEGGGVESIGAKSLQDNEGFEGCVVFESWLILTFNHFWLCIADIARLVCSTSGNNNFKHSR